MNSTAKPQTEQHSLLYSLVLHLFPGLLNGFAFFMLAPLARRNNLPPFAVLSAVNLIILIPTVLALLYSRGYKLTGRLSLDGVVVYRERIHWWEYLVYVPIVFVLPPVLIIVLKPVTNLIQSSLFSWWPPIYDLTTVPGQLPRSILTACYVLYFLSVSIAAPIAEELYFRGYLLPRLSRFGASAVVFHSVLFAVFHIWTPWMFVARAIGLLPLIWVAQKKRNIYIGMIAHMGVNAVDIAVGMMTVFSHL